jgi:NAD(P)-dependent dehydrogenase (short-subunit alcohol dehydrogenase family)
MVMGRAAPGDQRLRGRVGIITGAASGIGAAGADLFAAHGAALVLLDQDPAGGQRVADAITARHGRAVFLSGDAASADDVTRAVRTATERFGKLDLLWANAGTGVAKTVPQTTLEEWNRVLAVNLTGAFLLAKYGFPELAAGGGGTMVITGSANSFAADRSWAAYCASKGGLLMLCRALALDHAADGIRVNIVCPGSVTTPLHEDWLRGRPGGRPLPEVREEDRAAHPLGRFADPVEVARAALFLSSAESSFTTGSPLLVDGGVTA